MYLPFGANGLLGVFDAASSNNTPKTLEENIARGRAAMLGYSVDLKIVWGFDEYSNAHEKTIPTHRNPTHCRIAMGAKPLNQNYMFNPIYCQGDST